MTPRNYIHIDFYSERKPISTKTVHRVAGGKLSDELRDKREVRDGILREVEVGVVLDIPGAESLASTGKAEKLLRAIDSMDGVQLRPSRIAPLADEGVALSFLTDTFRASIDFYDTGEVVATIASAGARSDVWEIETDEELEDAVRRIDHEIS